jgi:UDP-N-acetylmuramoylalanine--D-glutamate ligase
MEQAVRRATTIARGLAPAVVLLSPAAASFDMFHDYEARGAAFKAAVAVVAGEDSWDARDAGIERGEPA